jgi:hypothetical protein
MATDGLPRIVCALILLIGLGELASLPATDNEQPKKEQSSNEQGDNERTDIVTATLAVQSAMQQGRALLERNDAQAAVRVLESQLGRINGNLAYLNLLRDAYRAYVRQLSASKQDSEVQRYLRRLQLLDPGSALDYANLRPAVAAPTPAATAPSKMESKPQPSPKTIPEPKAQAKSESGAEIKVRPQMPDEESEAPKPNAKRQAVGTLLAKADDEFGKRHYREAGSLYDQVNKADPDAVAASKDRWAYCKLSRVVEQLNAPGEPPLTDLEKEVRQVMQMAPKLDYAKTVMAEIDKRKPGANLPPVAKVEVRHYERGQDGWARAETANFRIFHTQGRELAEQVAQVAERTRTEMGQKWFGGFKDNWEPRCDIYLHRTSSDYNRSTGVAGNSPGHSTIKNEGSRILSRKIDLHCDDPRNMVIAVLPHETTHVVLAGQFGDQPVPRWADEGMAVLTEPRDKIDRHLKNLTKCRDENSLFHVKQLLQMSDYPEPRYISGFYAQSVSVVDYLSTLKGPQTFSQFMREALKVGYEPTLTKYYGFRNWEELQQRWSAQAFGGAAVASGQ